MSTPIDKELLRMLAKKRPEFKFVSTTWLQLQTEENRAEMIKWMKKNEDASPDDIMIQALEIAMKDELL